MHLYQIAALIAAQLIALLVVAKYLRRQISAECLRFRALGWNEHREQALAANNRRHPRGSNGQYKARTHAPSK